MVGQEEATICRKHGERCGWCTAEPYSEDCVRYQEEIGAALTDDESYIYASWRFERFVRRIKDSVRKLFSK